MDSIKPPDVRDKTMAGFGFNSNLRPLWPSCTEPGGTEKARLRAAGSAEDAWL